MKLDPIVKKILNKRGICAEADIVEFLSDKPRKTYDPFLLPDMEAGVDLILSETGKGSKICVYGDYDADGITSTVPVSYTHLDVYKRQAHHQASG